MQERKLSVHHSPESQNHLQEAPSGPIQSPEHRTDQLFHQNSATSMLRLNTHHKTLTAIIPAAFMRTAVL